MTDVDVLREALKPQLSVVPTGRTDVPELSVAAAKKGLILSTRGRRLLGAKSVDGEDRSARLFELASILRDAEASKSQSFVLLRNSVWNKFSGRDDEVERLWEAIERSRTNGKAASREPVRKRPRSRATPLSRLLGRNVPASEWAVERIWENKGWGFIAGEPKTYKSTFACDLAVSMATGTDFLGHFPVAKRGPVLIVQEENTENIQWARLNRILRYRNLGGKYHGVLNGGFEVTFPTGDCEVYCLDRSRFSFTHGKKRKALEADIRALQPALVVLDPIQRMMGELSIRDERDVTKVLDWLDGVVQSYKTGILLVHHYHKRREEGPMQGGQRMLGSQALHAWLSCGLYMQRVSGHRLKVDREFRAFADGGPFELEFQSEDDQDFYHVDVFESMRTGPQEELLQAVLQNPWQTAQNYADAIGKDRSHVIRVGERLKLRRKKILPKDKKGGRPVVVFGPPHKTPTSGV